MDDLIARLTAATGLEASTAQRAAALCLAFLRKNGPPEEVEKLIAAIPGAEDVVRNTAETGPGALGGGVLGMMGMGGGVMELGQKLMAAGVGMNQMQPLGRELFAYGREKAGEDTMGAIIASVPGMNQFL